MRRLVYGINLTLDGCCDHTKGIADEETHGYYAERMGEADTLVFGRKTYELMVPFWPEIAKSREGPKSMVDFALAFDAVEKIVVFSRSLTRVENKKTEIARGDLTTEIQKLKSQPGKKIHVGGVDLPTQLLHLGLIDEFQVVFHPVFAGRGRRLFDELDLAASPQLQLTETKTFKSGSIALHYLKR